MASLLFVLYNRDRKEFLNMVKVKMNVQTAYHGELFRAGKVYEVDEETAKRWIASKLAIKVEED
jgi:transposase-like protein